MSLTMTASQTVGPFFEIGLAWAYKPDLFDAEVAGPRLSVSGVLRDGDGLPIADAVIELWQADAHGRYASSDAARARPSGFGRVSTAPDGAFRFTTIKPGRVPGTSGALQAPHLSVLVFMRGLLKPVRTRMYFPDARENADDPVLGLVPPARRGTLIARPVSDGELAWDIHMQGAEETVFLDY